MQARTRQPGHTVTTEPCAKWVRGFKNGQAIVDTRRALLLFETGHVPVYYFPVEDVRMDLLQPTEHHTFCPYKGEASYYSIVMDGEVSENAAWAYPEPLDEEAPDLRGYVAFYWNRMDAWFEEDEQVYVHARDPHKRIDALPSSRHVKVVVNGETIAETRRPVLLFETGLPVRYYIPLLDVRQDALRPSDKVTRCPYKGEAHYYSVVAGGETFKDLVWYYQYPTLESARIAGHLAFFNEKVDLYVDGELQERPKTKWS